MTNQWEFTGEVIAVLKNGKITKIVLERPDGVGKDGAAKVARCVCQTWHDTVPIVGDVILAYGLIAAREWQGKWYGELNLEMWHLLSFETQPEKRITSETQTPPAPAETRPLAPPAPDPKPEEDNVPF